MSCRKVPARDREALRIGQPFGCPQRCRLDVELLRAQILTPEEPSYVAGDGPACPVVGGLERG